MLRLAVILLKQLFYEPLVQIYSHQDGLRGLRLFIHSFWRFI